MNMTNDEIRKNNLLLLIKEVGKKSVLAKLADTDPAYISQVLSKGSKKRNIGDDFARKLEVGCNKPRGWMDVRHDGLDNTEIASTLTKGVVPLIEWGQVSELTNNGNNYAGHLGEWLPAPTGCSEFTYALKVKGDSMTSLIPGTRSYPDGIIIFVDPLIKAISGYRVIAKLPNTKEVTFKELREDMGRLWLMPLNSNYEKLEVTENIIICGTVIGSYLPER